MKKNLMTHHVNIGKLHVDIALKYVEYDAGTISYISLAYCITMEGSAMDNLHCDDINVTISERLI